MLAGCNRTVRESVLRQRIPEKGETRATDLDQWRKAGRGSGEGELHGRLPGGYAGQAGLEEPGCAVKAGR